LENKLLEAVLIKPSENGKHVADANIAAAVAYFEYRKLVRIALRKYDD